MDPHDTRQGSFVYPSQGRDRELWQQGESSQCITIALPRGTYGGLSVPPWACMCAAEPFSPSAHGCILPRATHPKSALSRADSLFQRRRPQMCDCRRCTRIPNVGCRGDAWLLVTLLREPTLLTIHTTANRPSPPPSIHARRARAAIPRTDRAAYSVQREA